jgi:hypothetical protein
MKRQVSWMRQHESLRSSPLLQHLREHVQEIGLTVHIWACRHDKGCATGILTSSGRHDDEAIATRKDAVDGLSLHSKDAVMEHGAMNDVLLQRSRRSPRFTSMAPDGDWLGTW